VDRAVRAAFAKELGGWSPYERQALLHRVHDIIDRNLEEIAWLESLDMGADQRQIVDESTSRVDRFVKSCASAPAWAP
jgi:acyl-CoA reductase-like NAD-dependent aldehyde dehydrogenase